MPKQPFHYIDGVPCYLTYKSIKSIGIRIKMEPLRIEISSGYMYTKEDIHRAIKENEIKITARIKRAKSAPKCQVFSPKFFEEKVSSFYLFGKQYELILSSQFNPKQILDIQGETLIFNSPYSSSKQLNNHLIEGCKELMYRELETLMPELKELTNLTPAKVTVKQMKTRWGSCNVRSHNISINLELVRLPKRCLRYVMIHELMHIHERLHNKRFYSLVQYYMEDWQKYETYLDQFMMGAESVPSV